MNITIKRRLDSANTQIIFLLIALFAAPVVWADKPLAPESITGVTTVSTEQSIEMILNNPELVVVDARLKEEYQKGHIEDAIHLVDSAVNGERLTQILAQKDTPVLFYCNGPRCLRSSRAAQKALKHGYTNIYWYREGWAGWLNNELPIAH